MNNITAYCSTYNSIRFIDGYLENINNQACGGFDLIFIDAGSTDGSLERIKDFSFNRHINVSIYEPGFLSVYGAWNLGVQKATTPYVFNFNTDDRLNFYAIATYEQYIKDFPDVDLFYGVHNFVGEIGGQPLPLGVQWANLTAKLLLESEAKLFSTINPCGPFPLVKRSSLIEAGPFNDYYFSSADYDMWYRMLSMGKKFKRITEVIGDYYYRADSVSQANLKECEAHDKEIQNKYKPAPNK